MACCISCPIDYNTCSLPVDTSMYDKQSSIDIIHDIFSPSISINNVSIMSCKGYKLQCNIYYGTQILCL